MAPLKPRSCEFPTHRAAQSFNHTSGIQPNVHHAWNHNDLFCGHAYHVRVRKLLPSLDDRRAGIRLFRAPNAFSFWLSAFAQDFCSTSALLGADGLHGAGSAPDVGWFAYAPLTSHLSRSHSTDWTLSVMVSGFGSIGTAINIVSTILCLRCPGMTLGKMPLFAWLNLVMGGLVVLVLPFNSRRSC